MMNYIGAKQIQKFKNDFPNEKFIVLAGSSHINRQYTDIPGLAELTGSPTVVIEDLQKDNQTDVDIKTHKAKPDVLIRMDPTSNVAQITQGHISVKNAEVEEPRSPTFRR